MEEEHDPGLVSASDNDSDKDLDEAQVRAKLKNLKQKYADAKVSRRCRVSFVP